MMVRTKKWEDGTVSEVCNIVNLKSKNAPDELYGLFCALIDKLNEGYKEFRVSKDYNLETLSHKIVFDFRKDDKWEYLSMEFPDK